MWMLHIASGRTVRVLADRSAQEFAWSPDGRSVAYHSARGGVWEIWEVPISGLSQASSEE
jgi:Tol biopolymer transport system component